MFGLPGGLEWLVIGLIALLLFGKRLPGVARALGQALHEFKDGLAKGEKNEAPPTPPAPRSESDENKPS